MLWMTIVPLTSSAFFTLLIFQNEMSFESLSVFKWALLFMISVLTMALAITPTTYVALVGGYFIGFWGIIPLILAYQTASVFGFYLAKKLDNGFIQLIVDKYPKASGIIQQVEKNQYLLTFLSRLSPALPFALMNVVLSAAQIRLKQFFWGGLIGMLPRSLFFIWIGIQASKLSDAMNRPADFYISIGLTLVVIVVIFKVLKVKTKVL